MKIKQFSSLNICLQIFLAALAFRFFMYLISALILAFQAGEGAAFGWEYFLTCWCKWDANHYINIAEHGYELPASDFFGYPVCGNAYIYHGLCRGLCLYVPAYPAGL